LQSAVSQRVIPGDKARAELWKRGELGWKLHSGQLKLRRAFQAITRGKLFVGDCSRQLGKSTWAVVECVQWAIKHPGSRIRYGTAFFTDLEAFIQPAFEFVLDDCPDHLRPTYNAQRGEWRFPDWIAPNGKRRRGSVIKLVGLDRKPNGLRGNKLDLIIVDEAGFVARLQRLYRSVIIPSTTHVRHARIIMISTQPETADHDFVDFCDLAELRQAYVCLDVYQNPLLTKEQIDELAEECGGYESTEFRREYLCKREKDPKRSIIPEWKAEFVKPAVPDKYFQFYAKLNSMDVGVKQDKTVDLFAYYDFMRAKLVIQRDFTIWGPEMDTDVLAKGIKAMEKELWTHEGKKLPVYKRIVDNSDPLLAQDLTRLHGLSFMCTDKDSLHAMVNLVKIWVKQGRIEVDPECAELIGCLEKGIWNEKRDEFAHSSKYGHYDALAALVYLVRFVERVVQHDNTIPDWFEAEGTTKRFQKKAPELTPLGEQMIALLAPRVGKKKDAK
jgi:hypothetical protein